MHIKGDVIKDTIDPLLLMLVLPILHNINLFLNRLSSTFRMIWRNKDLFRLSSSKSNLGCNKCSGSNKSNIVLCSCNMSYSKGRRGRIRDEYSFKSKDYIKYSKMSYNIKDFKSSSYKYCRSSSYKHFNNSSYISRGLERSSNKLCNNSNYTNRG